MSNQLLKYNFVSKFTCLAQNCPDTCCKNWHMQVNNRVVEKYFNEITELKDKIRPDGELYVMCQDKETGHCVCFKEGLCSTVEKYGSDALGDACFFYPRILRKTQDQILLSGTMSCPEMARIMLFDSNDLLPEIDIINDYNERLPEQMKKYDFPMAQEVNQILVSKIDKNLSADLMVMSYNSIAASLTNIDHNQWHDASMSLIDFAHNMIPEIDKKDDDIYCLLITLVVLIKSINKPISTYMAQILRNIVAALNITFDWESVAISGNGIVKFNIDDRLNNHIEHILQKIIIHDVISSFFPYGGTGSNPQDRALTLAFRYAILKLCFKSHASIHQSLGQQEATDIVYNIYRFLGHLQDPTLLVNICREYGWHKLSRMRSMIMLR